MGNIASKNKAAKKTGKLMVKTLDYVITAYAQLHATVRSFRPPVKDNDPSRKVMESLEENVAKVVAGKMLVMQAYKTFTSMVRDEDKWKEFSDFWDQLSSYLEDDKKLVVKIVGELMRQEIDHMWHFQGLFTLIQMYPPDRLKPKENTTMRVLARYSFNLANFNSLSYLFLEMLPQHLSPNLFFSTADALYLFIYNYFLTIVEKESISDFPFVNKMAYNFVQLGTMCPKSKLEFPNPKDAERAYMQSTGKHALSPGRRFHIAILSKLKVVQERFNNHSQILANNMHEVTRVPLFKQYRVQELYGKLMNDAVKQVKSVYIQMRRIVLYIFLRVYPMRELYNEVQKLLTNGLNIYFYDCIDMLKVCQESIKNVQEGNLNFESLTRKAFQEVYVPYRSECIALPGICKAAVVEHICLFYDSLRDDLLDITVDDIIMYAHKCAGSGCNPTTNGEAWSYCKQGINAFMHMSSELESAVNECQDTSKLVILIPEERDRSPAILQNFFLRANENVELLERGPAATILSTLHLLPLNDELRNAIVSEIIRRVVHPPNNEARRQKVLRDMGEVFLESHPEFTPSPAPSNPYFPKWVIDMQSFVPPQQDLLTKEEIDTLFKFYV